LAINVVSLEVILKVGSPLVLLEYLSKNSELTSVIALAFIPESQGRSPLDGDISRGACGQLIDLSLDAFVFHAREQATLGRLNQLDDRIRDSSQAFGAVGKQIEEVAVQHPVKHCLLLFGLVAQLFQAFIFEFQLTHFHVFFECFGVASGQTQSADPW
jgi:hypothetical protein